MLYTDGLVEVPGRDLSVGIDKLLGETERLVPRSFEGGGEPLVTGCGTEAIIHDWGGTRPITG